jgi:hypothetical protein
VRSAGKDGKSTGSFVEDLFNLVAAAYRTPENGDVD